MFDPLTRPRLLPSLCIGLCFALAPALACASERAPALDEGGGSDEADDRGSDTNSESSSDTNSESGSDSSSDTGGDEDSRRAADFAKLDACGLLSDGELPTPTDDELDEASACAIDCLLDAATCDDLLGLTCDPGSFAPSDALSECQSACDELHAFDCGGGLSIPGQLRCDGQDHCPGASDEADCPLHTRADGQEVVGEARCNLEAECNDGSDEAGCAELVCPGDR